LLYVILLLLVSGLYGVAAIVVRGHGATTNTGSLVPWGLQIATYLYFALISAGCTFVNFFGERFYRDQYTPFAPRIVFAGLVTAAAGFLSLASEMGHLERMFYFMVSPNLSSPMFWMAVWYTLYLLMKVIEFYRIQSGRHSAAVSWATFTVAIITYCTLGSLLGTVSSRPYYHSALMPVHFLFLGTLSGAALSLLLGAIRERGQSLRPFIVFLRIGLALVLVSSTVRILTGAADSMAGGDIFRLNFASDFYFGTIAAIVVPLLVLWRTDKRGWLILTAVYVLVSQIKVRTDMVSGAFSIPAFRAYDVPPVIGYTPSFHELLVLVASIALTAACYIVCDRAGLFAPVRTGGRH
jgi:molybdopterin-containing oxidoreductase family membrane subunit